MSTGWLIFNCVASVASLALSISSMVISCQTRRILRETDELQAQIAQQIQDYAVTLDMEQQFP